MVMRMSGNNNLTERDIERISMQAEKEIRKTLAGLDYTCGDCARRMICWGDSFDDELVKRVPVEDCFGEGFVHRKKFGSVKV